MWRRKKVEPQRDELGLSEWALDSRGYPEVSIGSSPVQTQYETPMTYNPDYQTGEAASERIRPGEDHSYDYPEAPDFSGTVANFSLIQ